MAQKQTQTQKDDSTTSAKSPQASPEISTKEHPVSQLQRTIGNQAVLRMLQPGKQAKGAAGPELQGKADAPEKEADGKDLKDKTQQTGTQNQDRNGNSDKAVHWWNPFGERIAQYGFGGVEVHTNVDKKTLRDYTDPWKRNALDSGLFTLTTGVATEVFLKRQKLDKLTSKAMGLGIPFALGYAGIDLRERIRCKLVDVYSWYGRFRYNPKNDAILAVEYWAKGPTYTSIVSPVYYEQAIVDASEKVLFVYTNELTFRGLDLDKASTTLPLFSYGKVDKD